MKQRRAIRSAPLAIVTIAVFGPLAAAQASEELAAPSVRGSDTFAKYCSLCHGAAGKGDGRGARMTRVPPADLTQSMSSAEYQAEIIRKGGEAMNRSASMPSWADVLSATEIDDVVAYLQVLSATVRAPTHEPVAASRTTDVEP